MEEDEEENSSSSAFLNGRRLRSSLKKTSRYENYDGAAQSISAKKKEAFQNRRLSFHEQSLEEALELTDLEALVQQHETSIGDHIDLDNYDDTAIVAINLLNARSKLAFAKVDETRSTQKNSQQRISQMVSSI